MHSEGNAEFADPSCDRCFSTTVMYKNMHVAFLLMYYFLIYSFTAANQEKNAYLKEVKS